MSSTDQLLRPGTRLNDIYEIEEHIADGGIGTVYRARAIDTGDAVAIKVLLSQYARDPLILDLFKREAQILRRLKADALTQYFVFTKEPSLGVYYLAMEFIDGPSLGKRLESGPLSVEATYTLLRRVAATLQIVHDREVIHRDLAPDNIILQNSDVGQAKIIDFGISRANVGNGTIIGDGFAGKVNYVSPEQLGLFDGNVTPKSDIYSLGLVIAESLTGRQLNMGGNQAQMIEKRRIVPPLEGIDLRFRPLLEAMLQPNPADRPATMTEVANWTLGAPMRAVIADRTVIQVKRPEALPKEPEEETENRPGWGRKVIGGLSLFGFAALGAGAVYFVLDPELPEDNRKPVLVENGTRLGDGSLVAPPASTLGQPADPKPDSQMAALPDKPAAERPRSDKLDVPELPDEAKVTPQAPTVSSLPTLTMQPQATPEEVLSPADRIRKFVGTYRVSDCLYLRLVEAGDRSAMIEGFADAVDPMLVFDKDFKEKQGFEANIQANIVSQAQCPAVALLRATPPGGLKLDLRSTVIKSGGNLEGTISGPEIAGDSLALVLVTSDGTVLPLTRFVSANAGRSAFSTNPLNLEGGREEAGMLIAMIGKPGFAREINNTSGQNAKAVFSQLVDNVSVLRRYATMIKIVP